MAVELSENLLRKAAGWDVVKRARAYLELGQVLNSHWAAPLLRGVVQVEGVSFRACLAIQGEIDIENLCTCREAREWGKICAHGVAVGLHWLRSQEMESALRNPSSAPPPPSVAPRTELPSWRGAAGQPAELFLIFPPNLGDALSRGKIMITLEARGDGNRCPLNTLAKKGMFAFSAQDEAVLARLEEWSGGATPALVQLSAGQLASLLPMLVGHPRLSLGRTAEARVITSPFQPQLRATLEPNGEITLTLKAAIPASRAGDWIWQENAFQPWSLPPAAARLLHGPVRLRRAEVPGFILQHWSPTQSSGFSVEANFTPENFDFVTRPPRFLLELRGGLASLSALLQCRYGIRILRAGQVVGEEDAWMPDPESPTRYAARDLAAERAALARLRRHGFSAPDTQGQMRLSGENAVLNFLASDFAALQREWTVTLDEHLERRTLQNLERIEPRFEIRSSGMQWFDLGVVFAASGGETFTPAEIQRLLLSGQSHTRLRNGKTAVIDTDAVEELREVLLDCAPQQQAGGYRMESRQAGFLEATLRRNSQWQVEAPAAWRERAARQSGEAPLECPPLGPLEGILRSYQKHGVAWLRFLRANGFGGILADEMGLGKTAQALAHLELLRTEPGGPVSAPHLVICPTSLVSNWMAEARTFAPGLKALALHGSERHAQFGRISAHDLVVTSYALIRRDAERYRALEFDTVILDEAQHIKNRETQNAQAVKAVRSRHRLVLTGTPLENSVLDLWSIFDFLMPGYLGSAKDFRERYELPITRERDAGAQSRLARRLRPFLLRRLKAEVASDLPAKLEHVAFCDLTPAQRGVYQQVIEASRKEILTASGEQGLARSRMLMLTALLRLRQICCDLRLLKTEGVDPATASGKLELFGELLEQAFDGGHRLLVFSQFVGMLALLRERLEAEGIPYCYLDGSTVDRAEVVDRFQRNGSVPIFLISLKAGGVGLNLTGADTVIHFDPWWNPAVEDQATDRAHRIGQTRVVTSYKLVARDTIEEKILALQKRKRELIQATVGGEEQFTAALTWDEIQELLG